MSAIVMMYEDEIADKNAEIATLRAEISNLKAALCKLAEQEPVAWVNASDLTSARLGRERYGKAGASEMHTWREGGPSDYHKTALYAAPVPKE